MTKASSKQNEETNDNLHHVHSSSSQASHKIYRSLADGREKEFVVRARVILEVKSEY